MNRFEDERVRRIHALPEDVYEFVATMSSHLLSQDLAEAYLTNREHRVTAASIARQLGVRGEELGFVMNVLHDLALGNAQPRRRRQLNRRFL